MTEKRKPQRMCVGCGEMKAKQELLRIVRTTDGNAVLDMTGKTPGRGAYLCKSSECFMKARKSGRLSRTLSVAVPTEVYEKLESEIKNIEG